MEICDIVNPGHVAFSLFFTHFLHIINILQKSEALFSTTYIFVVIDCTWYIEQ